MANYETYHWQSLYVSVNDDNVAFTRISRMIYIACPKMDDGVLTFL